MFDKAGDKLQLSQKGLEFAWDMYTDGVKAALGTGANVLFAALHVGATAIGLGAAAVSAGSAGAIKLAELSVRAARAGVLQAEKGVETAGEAAVLAAELSARAANNLAHADQDQYAIKSSDLVALEQRVEQMEAAA